VGGGDFDFIKRGKERRGTERGKVCSLVEKVHVKVEGSMDSFRIRKGGGGSVHVKRTEAE